MTYSILRIYGYNVMMPALMLGFLIACSAEEPIREDTPELITTVTLTFTSSDGGEEIVVTANDPDGEGIEDIEVDGPIDLAKGKTYDLEISLVNGLAEPSAPGYDVTAEVREESDEHLFFFSWTNNVFSTPSGDGNIDNRADEIDYNDEDSNGLPLGLETRWTTGDVPASGKFSVLLKHQPDLKSEDSDSGTGESDLDVEFTINIE